MTLYVDTSSLVKLYVTEAGSDVVRQLLSDARVVATSVVAYAETRAPLAKLRRKGALTASKLESAKSEFEEQWQGQHVGPERQPQGQVFQWTVGDWLPKRYVARNRNSPVRERCW